ncbi:MAG: MFS transporter [Planctomycetes bacterium]|nr:MFS transporter [Planctomycetota bacterium]
MTNLFLLAASDAAPPLDLSLQIPLSVLHFLEFAIWGAWWVVLGNYLNSIGFTRKQIGSIYATMPIGSILAPMFIGTVADRFFAGEQLMGVLHLAGAGLLFWLAKIKSPRPFFWVALVYALVYSPTLALVNSIPFAHIPDAQRDFPVIRVLGTIGWIFAGLSLKFFLRPGQPVNNRPILLAAALSLALGVFSFFLPHTPPQADASGEIPFLRAMALFKEPSFAVFFGVSFLITIALAFYYSFTALFLERRVGVRAQNVGPVMTIGQWMEIIFLLALPWFLEYFGMKWVLAMGMAAWAIRYALFAIGSPLVLVILGIALHGICFDFFFAAGFIHVEQTAAKDIANSAQSLFAVLTYGLGMYLGTEAAGRLNHALVTQQEDAESSTAEGESGWTMFWLIPCLGASVCLLLFLLLS